jgi:hypothetical protein
MPSPTKCGSHTEILSNNTVRVTRCACGTVHVTLIASGVTVRMSGETFRNAASGLKMAADRIDESSAFGTTSIN